MLLSKCCKFFYFIFCVLLCITDVFVIGLVSWILILLVQYNLFLPFTLYWPIIILIFLNVIQFFGFWQGFLGILKENKIAIITFCTSLILNAIFDLIIGVFNLSIYTDIHIAIGGIMKDSYVNYTKLQMRKEEWNKIQTQLLCCGIDGPQNFFEIGTDFLPISCCNSTTNSKFCENGEFYKNGCLNSLTVFIQKQQYHLILIVLAFVGIQILGIGIFCRLNAILNKAISSEPTAPKQETQEILPLRKRSLHI